MNKFIYIIRIFLLLFSIVLGAQEVPPITNYSALDYGAGNQNWSISQSEDKTIYVANNTGLLEFNGAYWRLYPSPNNSVMRSVNVVDDRIYTGCFREFGFWKKNEFGNLQYQSLSAKVKGTVLEDEHFWNIVDFDDWILFQSLHNIYIFNKIDNSYKVIRSNTRLTKIFRVQNSIYYQKSGEGIYRIENGEPLLVADHNILKNEELVNIFILDKKLLYQTQESGFYFYKDSTFMKWDIPANSVISEITVYNSIKLKNGNVILGSISNGFYELDQSGKIRLHMSQKKGLSNNTVLSLFEDADENIWLGLDNGISILNFNGPIKTYNDVDGVLGSVYASATSFGNLYLGTNQGLFYKEKDTEDDFKLIVGTEGQVWSLKIIDGTLFCGHNKGTFIIEKNKAHLISEVLGTWEILPLKNNDNLMIQGHYNGLNVLEKTIDGWQFRNNIEGFYDSCRFIASNKDNEIYVNHEYKGVVRLVINDDFTKVIEIRKESSVTAGLRSSLINFNDQLLYTSSEGVYSLNNQKDFFIRDSLLSKALFGKDGYVSGKLIANETDNTLWGFTDKNVILFQPGKLNDAYRPLNISLTEGARKFVTGYENTSKVDSRKYLFGTTNGYMILDLNRLEKRDYQININNIEKSTNKGESIPVDLDGIGEFKNIEHNNNFKYSVVEYDKFSETYYQYLLEGIYDDWSKWTTTPEVSFSNLPFGRYKFKVRARIGTTISKNVAVYEFTIEKPWYLSNLAMMGYTLVLMVIFIIMHHGYDKHYAAQQRKLIEDSNKRLELSRLENNQKLTLLTNEQLRQDIENRNSELAISTMSLIKKNQLLRTIKNEISHVEEQTELKPVIKIIDENLNNSNDWEFFQKAFNDADKDFFKKIHEIHPTLTPNDLRFCAYLRLNLNSKEIAPLLNISYRSVEIKRYRLRKKMGLAHEKSLVEYILEF